jgi:hypothetical protein
MAQEQYLFHPEQPDAEGGAMNDKQLIALMAAIIIARPDNECVSHSVQQAIDVWKEVDDRVSDSAVGPMSERAA